MDEKWLPIPGNSKYEVSSHGNVRSHHTCPPRPIKQRIIQSGKRGGLYWGFNIKSRDATGNQITLTFKTHVIVAELFVGPRPEGMYVLHRNDNKDHNQEWNLYYGTHTENMEDHKRNVREKGLIRKGGRWVPNVAPA